MREEVSKSEKETIQDILYPGSNPVGEEIIRAIADTQKYIFSVSGFIGRLEGYTHSLVEKPNMRYSQIQNQITSLHDTIAMFRDCQDRLEELVFLVTRSSENLEEKETKDD